MESNEEAQDNTKETISQTQDESVTSLNAMEAPSLRIKAKGNVFFISFFSYNLEFYLF